MSYWIIAAVTLLNVLLYYIYGNWNKEMLKLKYYEQAERYRKWQLYSFGIAASGAIFLLVSIIFGGW